MKDIIDVFKTVGLPRFGVAGLFLCILMMWPVLPSRAAEAPEPSPPSAVEGGQPGAAPSSSPVANSPESQSFPVELEPDTAEPVEVEDEISEGDQATGGPKRHARREYLPPTMQNLSKLYWALGLFNVENDNVAIDNYIMINECQIYRDYFIDDFEWKNVREVTRDHLRKKASSFPRRFEFIQPIELGRYTEETQTFEVLTEHVTKGSRTFFGDINPRNQKVCDKRGNVQAYPRNVIVSLSRPVHYPQIPVNIDIARDYIARTKIGNEEDFRNLPEHMMFLRHQAYQRLAFVVIKVRMLKFIEMRPTPSGVFPVIFSALEGVEIYEDPHKKRLLYSSLSRTKSSE